MYSIEGHDSVPRWLVVAASNSECVYLRSKAGSKSAKGRLSQVTLLRLRRRPILAALLLEAF